MSVVFSGTTQGVFTQTAGNPAQLLKIREGVDWIETRNITQMAAPLGTTGVEFFWQLGFPSGAAVQDAYNSGATATQKTYVTSGGFTNVTNTINTLGAAVNITSISNATPPVVTVASTAALSTGQIVRMYNTNSEANGLQLGSIDFTITVINGTTFSLPFMSAIAATTGGQYRVVPYDPYFYPPTRVISAITSSTLNGANVAVVSLTVTHAFTVGQKIRFLIPTVTSTAFGMSALNQVEGTILAVTNSTTVNTITVNVDVSALGTFAWPVSANGTFTPAQVVPVGENTSQALLAGVNQFQDAELNNGYLAISLAGGINSPAGVSGDVIYWVAGKSFSGGL